MKSINIKGKHNIDKLNKIGDTSYKSTRKHMDNLNDDDITHKIQLDTIRMLYLDNMTNDIKNSNLDIKSLITSEINSKIQGYKGQDIKKNIHSNNTLIIYDDVLEKLIGNMLTCYYCKNKVVILYKNVREPYQWTLDRIDNSLSHTKDNTCISCLKCNLQRRVMDAEKFTFTKRLKINKV